MKVLNNLILLPLLAVMGCGLANSRFFIREYDIGRTKEVTVGSVMMAWGSGTKNNVYGTTLGGLRIDWDFKEFQTQYLSHRFHSYPARFIPQIPKTFIKLFTDENDIVIDPFCGCGTTIIKAFLNGRDSIGNDYNPLACLITKVKAQQ